jgi:hypothetical protein
MASKLGIHTHTHKKGYTPMPKMVMNSFRNKKFRQPMRGVNMERGGL